MIRTSSQPVLILDPKETLNRHDAKVAKNTRFGSPPRLNAKALSW